MGTLRGFSFAGGVVSESLFSRADLIKHATGLKTARNFMVLRHGALANRPGTKFVSEFHTSSVSGRLIPFIFNNTNTFILVFGNFTMRVVKNGAQITDSTSFPSTISNANPGRVVTAAPHGMTGADNEVVASGIGGMTEINSRNFKVAIIDPTTFDLLDMDGGNFDTTSLGVFSGGGQFDHVFQVTTPYPFDDLPDLQYAQSADVMTIVHPRHFIREVRRTSDTVWTNVIKEFRLPIQRPLGMATSGSMAGALDISYIVTAIDAQGQESGAGGSDLELVTAISLASPALVTVSGAHTFLAGEQVIFEGTSGMPEVRNRTFDVAAPIDGPGGTFTIPENTTAYTAEAFSLAVIRRGVNLVGVVLPTGGMPITVTWTPSGTAVSYRIYRRDALDGIYGFVGETLQIPGAGTTFIDTGVTPDITIQPPVERIPFFKAGLFPGAVSFFQQRLGFGGSDDLPEQVALSNIGFFANFFTYIPDSDSGTVIFSLIGQKVSRVKHLLDIGQLVVFTTSIEWRVEGNARGAITPTAVAVFAQSYNGSGNRRPIVIGGNALFLQERGTIVRDLRFDFQTEGYRGNELTIYANNLFDDFTIVDWDFQQIQHSLLWAVRSDGKMVTLTYIREHEIFAWTTHDITDGTIENVAVVSEGNEDILYMAVKRTINGRTARYVERMATRLVNPALIEDVIYLDSGLTFDGRNTGPLTLTISGGPPWGTFDPPLTLMASAPFFVAGDVGNEFVVRVGTAMVRFRIEAFTSTTVVTGSPDRDVPVAIQNTPTTDWDRAVDQLTNLHHLEGKAVSIFADGFVVANPNNSQYDTITVVDGIITLQDRFAVIHVGLPYTSDMETLDLESLNAETLLDKKSLISRVTLFLVEARGLFAGEQLPPTDLVQPVKNGGTLYELAIRDEEGYDDPVALKTGTADIEIRGRWNKSGGIVVRQTDPLPATLSAVALSGLIPLRR